MNNGMYGQPAGAFGNLLRVRTFTATQEVQLHPATRFLIVELASASTSLYSARRSVSQVGAPLPQASQVVVGASNGAATTYAGLTSGTQPASGGGAPGWATIWEFG